jgi:peptidyl-prolyl cis-trans isomerase C
MKLKHASLILLAALAAPAMAQKAPAKKGASAPAAAASGAAVATVNGKPIPASLVEQIVQAQKAQGQQDSPELRARIKDALIRQQVVVQEAEKEGYGMKPEVKAALDDAHQQILLGALQQNWVKSHTVSDADIKARYEKEKAANGSKEYLARHILVPTEDEAKQIITKLKGGAKFEDLAKAQSKDGSAAEGGSLGWASPARYVPEFAKPMVALKKGEVTDTPVKTQYGYHVIKLEDIRDAQFPPLEEVKQQVAEQIMQERFGEYVKSLVAKAKVQ